MLELISALGFESWVQFAIVFSFAIGWSAIHVVAGRFARPPHLR